MKKIKNGDAYCFQGLATYWILPDYASGSKGRYHTFILTCDDPVKIGCELPLKLSKELISEYENLFEKEITFSGYRPNAQAAVKIISARRRALNG